MTGSTGRDAARSMLRDASRRPRAWMAAARAHPSTEAVVSAGHDAFERAALTAAALRGRARRIADWDRLVEHCAALPAAEPLTRSVSIVMIAAGTGLDTASRAFSAIDALDVEVLIARPGPGETAAAAAARVSATARGDLLCFALASTSLLESGWLARLAAAIVESTVAAAPTVVHPLRSAALATPHDARIRARGLTPAVSGDAPALHPNGAGDIATFGDAPEPVDGTLAACLLVDRIAYEAAGSMPESDDIDIAVFELGRQLRARGGNVVVASDAVVVDHRDVASRRELHEPVSPLTPAWRSYVEAHGPALLRAADPLRAGALRIAITIAAPTEKVAPRWGDWHLATAMAGALRRLGHVVRVQTLDHADDLAGRACDVHCVIRGLAPVRRTPGQAHVLWIISHPEQVTAGECDRADLVLVASRRFADELRTRTSTPVEVMLQATDVTRFRPRPPEPRHTHDVAVVAKSRDVYRTTVADAIAVGLRPAIYGSGWERFVDPALVVTAYVANEELPVVYSSVGVLLNDHWQSMREWGFVSNRLFDALACETVVISDDLPEIAELFDGSVLTYRDPFELRTQVDAVLADRPAARTRAARGRVLVTEGHTFDHRAAQLVDALQRHGLAPDPPAE